jgi:hypothetical protein
MNTIDFRVPSEGEMRSKLSKLSSTQGFTVEDIPEEHDERADFLIWNDSEWALLELKIKGEDFNEASER